MEFFSLFVLSVFTVWLFYDSSVKAENNDLLEEAVEKMEELIGAVNDLRELLEGDD